MSAYFHDMGHGAQPSGYQAVDAEPGRPRPRQFRPNYSSVQPVCTSCFNRLTPDNRQQDQTRAPRAYCALCDTPTQSGLTIRCNPSEVPFPSALEGAA